MRGIACFALFLGACSAEGLPHPVPDQPAPAATVPAGNQCVWHFTKPSDTSDSDETPGVATCDEVSFELHDSILDVVAGLNSATVNRCTATIVYAGSKDGDWALGIQGCGVDGYLGVNLR